MVSMTSSVISGGALGAAFHSASYSELANAMRNAFNDITMPVQRESTTSLANLLGDFKRPETKFASSNIDSMPTSFSPNGVSVGKSNETQR